MTRARILTLVAVLIGFQLAFLNFDWYAISMSPNGKVTQLDNLSGSTAHPTVQALVVLVVLEFVLVLISKGKLARGFALALLLTNVAVSALGGWLFANQDLSAVHARINNLTNIAAAHDVTSIATDRTVNGWLFAVTALVLVGAVVFWVATPRFWVASNPKRRSETAVLPSESDETSDTIGLWESQRQKR